MLHKGVHAISAILETEARIILACFSTVMFRQGAITLRVYGIIVRSPAVIRWGHVGLEVWTGARSKDLHAVAVGLQSIPSGITRGSPVETSPDFGIPGRLAL